MNWFEIAQNDWEVYKDSSRIRRFVEFEKISQEQYQSITGQPY